MLPTTSDGYAPVAGMGKWASQGLLPCVPLPRTLSPLLCPPCPSDPWGSFCENSHQCRPSPAQAHSLSASILFISTRKLTESCNPFVCFFVYLIISPPTG